MAESNTNVFFSQNEKSVTYTTLVLRGSTDVRERDSWEKNLGFSPVRLIISIFWTMAIFTHNPLWGQCTYVQYVH